MAPKSNKDLTHPTKDVTSPLTVGRPSKFNWVLAKDICIRIQNGEFLTDICAEKDMPAMSDITRWSDKFPKFGQWLERSRKMAAHVLAEKSVKLFDDDPPMEVLQTKNGTIERISMSGVQRERYKSQSMQWLASKWGGENYGDTRRIEATMDLFTVLSSINAKPEKPMKTIEIKVEK
jgi:hypothetical protein